MKLKRTTGLVLSLALLLAPAMSAAAKPVTSHELVLQWRAVDSGITTIGSLRIVIDESGASTADLQVRRSGVVGCVGGEDAQFSSLLSFSGSPSLSTSVDRHLDRLSVSGEVRATETAVNTCMGSNVEFTQRPVTIELAGTGIDRLIRSRDRDSGTRYITRLFDVTLDLDGEVIVGQMILTKTIARA